MFRPFLNLNALLVLVSSQTNNAGLCDRQSVSAHYITEQVCQNSPNICEVVIRGFDTVNGLPVDTGRAYCTALGMNCLDHYDDVDDSFNRCQRGTQFSCNYPIGEFNDRIIVCGSATFTDSKTTAPETTESPSNSSFEPGPPLSSETTHPPSVLPSISPHSSPSNIPSTGSTSPAADIGSSRTINSTTSVPTSNPSSSPAIDTVVSATMFPSPELLQNQYRVGCCAGGSTCNQCRSQDYVYLPDKCSSLFYCADDRHFTCAKQFEICNCTGMVRYGLLGSFTRPRRVEGSIPCTNQAFGGNPLVGLKSCQCQMDIVDESDEPSDTPTIAPSALPTIHPSMRSTEVSSTNETSSYPSLSPSPISSIRNSTIRPSVQPILKPSIAPASNSSRNDSVANCNLESEYRHRCGVDFAFTGSVLPVICGRRRCCSPSNFCGKSSAHCSDSVNSIFSYGICPCVNVNYLLSRSGYYTCTCVRLNDPCLLNNACVEEPNCPTKDGQQSTYWSEWIDHDILSGNEDNEQRLNLESPPCDNGVDPVSAECRVVGSQVSAEDAEQVLALPCGINGLVCRNLDNADGCFNYEVRYECPNFVYVNQLIDNPGYYACQWVPSIHSCLSNGLCVEESDCPEKDGEAYTYPPTSTSDYWSPWLDRDNPDGNGDVELRSELSLPPCENDATPILAECRIIGSHIPANLSGQILELPCGTDGLVCNNAQNSGPTMDGLPTCFDYEVRYLCPPIRNIQYRLSAPSGSCSEACGANGCDEASFATLQFAEATIFEALDKSVLCTSYNMWNYGQGPSICTDAQCCQGDCVNACSFPMEISSCDAMQLHHSRICPCFKYFRASERTTCEENDSLGIADSDKCEIAARTLGIAWGSINANRSGDLPIGCFYQTIDDVILFNANNDTTTVFATAIDVQAICQLRSQRAFRFQGNFSFTFANDSTKALFLEQCSARYAQFQVRCADIIPGSIIVIMYGTRDGLNEVEKLIAEEGGIINLPDFANLLQENTPTKTPTFEEMLPPITSNLSMNPSVSPTMLPTEMKNNFDPSSVMTSYVDRGSCGPRGNDARADLSRCTFGYDIVEDASNEDYSVKVSIDGCDYFEYTIYQCRPAAGCCRFGDASSLTCDCGDDNTGWCHQSPENCENCYRGLYICNIGPCFYDPAGEAPEYCPGPTTDVTIESTNTSSPESITVTVHSHSKVIFGLDMHWSTVFLVFASFVIILFWIVMIVFILTRHNLSWKERRTDMATWTRSAIAIFDLCSDLAFTMFLGFHMHDVYFYLFCAILLIVGIKSFSLLIYRAPKLLREGLVTQWKKKTKGGFAILPFLFIMSGFSPLYYDILQTSQIRFPIYPPNLHFVSKEKFLHVLTENLCSICVVSIFMHYRGSQTVATISFISSVTVTFILLFTGGCETIRTREIKDGHSLRAEIVLRKEDMKEPPYRRRVKKEIRKRIVDASCVIHVWYICELHNNYHIYLYLQTHDQKQLFNLDDIKKTLTTAIDQMGYPTRRSIQVDEDNGNTPGIEMNKYAVNMTVPSEPLYQSAGQWSSSSTSRRGVDMENIWENMSKSTTLTEHTYVTFHDTSAIYTAVPDDQIGSLQRETTEEYIYEFGGGKSNHKTNSSSTSQLYGKGSDEFLKTAENSIRSGSEYWKYQLNEVNLIESTDVFVDMEDCIGVGCFSQVYIGTFRGARCAFKRSQGIEKYAQENSLYKDVSQHPNICRYYGICRWNKNDFFLVMEYFESGSLLDVVKRKKFSYSDKSHFCLELAQGLWHLHSENVLHNDLALRNVLIDVVKKRAVLTDFGQSCRSPCLEVQSVISPRWASPKLIQTRIPTFQSDIWALAVCFWELFMDGKAPYTHLSNAVIVSRLPMGALRLECGEWPMTPIIDHIFSNREKKSLSARWLCDKIQKHIPKTSGGSESNFDIAVL